MNTGMKPIYEQTLKKEVRFREIRKEKGMSKGEGRTAEIKLVIPPRSLRHQKVDVPLVDQTHST